ncbi:MAG: alanine racemase [Candidatus Auribacterota bacterium]
MRTVSVDQSLIKETKTSDVQNSVKNWVTIDLDALRHNIRCLRSSLSLGTEMLLIVKANAYGHGDKEIVGTAFQEGIRYFGVATIREAFELRMQYPQVRLVILDVNFPEDADVIVENDLTPIIYTEEMAFALNNSARQMNKILSVHVKIDTGMGRIGCWHGDAPDFIKKLLQYDHLRIEGLCTHFAAAESNYEFSSTQWNAFKQVVDHFKEHGITFPFYHLANSAGTFFLGLPYFNMVRIGIMAYGIMPRAEMKKIFDLKPVMSWWSKIIFVKPVVAGRPIGYGGTYITPHDTFIATIPIGYADGYMRALSNKGTVLINGKRYPVVGRISMDHIMVDLGTDSDISVGNDVLLFGTDGNYELSCGEVAACANTIPYELSCNAGRRGLRYYFY